jgi:nucleotidyltransferase substrate binding protein (TIGR01987 family)
MENKDIRWKQRFKNFSKALAQLQKFIDKGDLNELEEQGLIQAFEYTYELAWNTIKDYYENQGVTDIQGSRDAFKLAANRDLIKNVELWMDMVTSRTKTSHTYNEEIAKEIAKDIKEIYHSMFIQLQTRFQVEYLHS